jgi:hypothetical protein
MPALAGSAQNSWVPQNRQVTRPQAYSLPNRTLGERGSGAVYPSASGQTTQPSGHLPSFSPAFERDHSSASVGSAPSIRRVPTFSSGFSGTSGAAPPALLGSVPPPVPGRPNFAAPTVGNTSGPSAASPYTTSTYKLSYPTTASPQGNTHSEYTESEAYSEPGGYKAPSGYSTTTYAPPAAPTLPYSTNGSPTTYSAPSYQKSPTAAAQQSSYEVVPSTPIGTPVSVPTYAPGGHAIIPSVPQSYPTQAYSSTPASSGSVYSAANATGATNDTYFIQSGTGARLTAQQIANDSFPTGTFFVNSRTGEQLAAPQISAPTSHAAASTPIITSPQGASSTIQPSVQFPPANASITSSALPPLGSSGIANSTPAVGTLKGPDLVLDAVNKGYQLYQSVPVQGLKLVGNGTNCALSSMETIATWGDASPWMIYNCGSAAYSAYGFARALAK